MSKFKQHVSLFEMNASCWKCPASLCCLTKAFDMELEVCTRCNSRFLRIGPPGPTGFTGLGKNNITAIIRIPVECHVYAGILRTACDICQRRDARKLERELVEKRSLLDGLTRS